MDEEPREQEKPVESKIQGLNSRPWEKRKATGVAVDFSIKDCPLWLYKEFTKDIHKYNDTYWTKLMDITRKAGMYDYLVSGNSTEGIYEGMEEERKFEEETKPKDKYGVNTITGFNEYSEKAQEYLRKKKEDEGGKKNG